MLVRTRSTRARPGGENCSPGCLSPRLVQKQERNSMVKRSRKVKKNLTSTRRKVNKKAKQYEKVIVESYKLGEEISNAVWDILDLFRG